MTSRNGYAYCDICNKKLSTQHERYDLYKRRLGSFKIKSHYCSKCFDETISILHNEEMKKYYDLLCKGINNGNIIKIGENNLNVFDAVMLKNKMERDFGFKEK